MLLTPELQAFNAITATGTVHAAAKQLGLTQTAVTRRLAALEAELGASLFLRSRRGMEMTDAGMALAGYCRQMLDLEGETLARVRGAAADVVTTVRFQGHSSIMRARILPALRAVAGALPQLSLSCRIADVSSGALALKSGQTDFAVLRRAEVASEFASKVLQPERYILVGPLAWLKRPLADVVRTERIIDFDESDDMTFEWLTMANQRENARHDRHFVNNTDALAALVAEGAGYSVLAAEFAAPLIEAGRIAQLGGRRFFDYPIALAWYPRRHMPLHFAAVVRAVR